MQRLELRATHKPVQNYYAALRQFDDLGVTHETAVRSAFRGLLDHCARQPKPGNGPRPPQELIGTGSRNVPF